MFGGFGSNNQNQQSSGFGGFGSNSNNTSTGFGGTSNAGFGGNSSTSGTSLFGNNSNTGGFGSAGFGSNNNTSGFGSGGERPGFGATGTAATTSLFGGSNNASSNNGFGGFGGSNTGTSTGFGSANTGSSLFGATSKPAFGNSTTTSAFGSGTTSFGGASQPTSGFGGSGNTGFSGNQNQQQGQGTGGTPFQAHVENDGTSGAKSAYQSIVFQQPYQQNSFEELRCADYAQGRKHGNASGQPGAFGASTGFGGFGGQQTTSPFGAGTSSNTGGFGSTSNSSPFGQNQQSSSNPFGSTNTGSSLFGQQNKPAGGLFGSTTTSGQSSGGLFGTANNTTTTTTAAPASGFGSTPFGQTSTATSGSLFGSTNNQSKPTFGFGNQNNQQSGGLFGGQNNNQTSSAGGLFGNSNTGTSGFGQQTSQQGTSGGLFGGGGFGQQNQNNPSQQQGQSGGLFGNQNQPKPGGLFGSTGGSSLFGNQNQNQGQQQQSGGLFGSQNNNQQGSSGGLFGSRPAASGLSLFGGSSNNNNASSNTGGLFGNQQNQNQQNQGNSLFGSVQNQQKPGGLFGSTGNTGTNSLFGNNNNQQQSSVFGTNQNQQSQLGGSMFGNSQQQQQQQQQPQQLTTSIMSNNPYGNEHLFVSLATPPQSVGPLATPLSSSQKARKPAPLPQYKINPAASSRLITPQKRSGFGFSYSTYGTPGSASNNASPTNYSGLLGSSRLGGSLSKSFSMNNLRGNYSGDSILAPGAFSPGSARSPNGAGSLKRLNINRNLRTDLFGTDGTSDAFKPSPLKKKVSFEADAARSIEQGSAGRGNEPPSNALVRVEERDSATPTADEQSPPQPSKNPQTNGVSRVEMEQIKGNELAIVPENGPPPAVSKRATNSAVENARQSQTDQKPGRYWIKPSLAELRKVPRERLKKVKGLVVGREGCGKIEFGECDLSSTDLDKICGDVVQINTRSATVYLDNATKPQPGKNLNVPSIVTLENSWPRAKGGRLPVYEKKGPRFDKHITRLRRVEHTQFENYNERTGEWTFKVNHFSTYTLEYEDADSSTGLLSAPPDTPTPARSSNLNVHSSQLSQRSQDLSIVSDESAQSSHPDDTFAFRHRRSLPGAFDDESFFDDEKNIDHSSQESVFGQGPTNGDLQLSMVEEDSHDHFTGNDSGIESDREMDMAGSFPKLDGVGDVTTTNTSPSKTKSILKPTQQHFPSFGLTPSSKNQDFNDDWVAQLQRTISPKKQHRESLRRAQVNAPTQEARGESDIFDKSANPFATSIDVMNSLFGYDGGRSTIGNNKQNVDGNSFQSHAYNTTNSNELNIEDPNKGFLHSSFNPHWNADGVLVSETTTNAGQLRKSEMARRALYFEDEVNESDKRLAVFPADLLQLVNPTLKKQQELTEIELEDGVPRAYMHNDFSFSTFAADIEPKDEMARHERLMWQLAAVLFDEETEGITRKEKLSAFWKGVVHDAAEQQAARARSAEERAIAHLSGENIPEACKALLDGHDFRLATQLPFIGGSQEMQKGMSKQISEWRNLDIISEMTAPIRALYELLAGNTCVSQGKQGAGPENKAETFGISSRFGLDWRRSFGLRLWYGILEQDNISDAVDSYACDLETGDEAVRPVPWFVEQSIDTGCKDENSTTRQDILWGLLKIFAYNEQQALHGSNATLPKPSLEAIISPYNLAGNPLKSRLSFQLYQLLTACGIFNFPSEVADHKADLLATDYAFNLTSNGNSNENLLPALFVSLHICEPNARREAVESLLARLGFATPEPTEFSLLVGQLATDFKIPEAWSWEARAPYIKTVVQDDVALVECLLRAGDVDGAHDVLASSVAPLAVVEEEYADLKALLLTCQEFGAAEVSGWGLGGELYVNYISLVEILKREKEAGGVISNANDERDINHILSRLGIILADKGQFDLPLEERVAVTEMAGVVAAAVERRVARKGYEGLEDVDMSLLPLAQNGSVRGFVEASKQYYAAFAAA